MEFVTQGLQRLGTSADPGYEFPMWYLKFRGKLRFRSMKFESGMNECPKCGHSPVICPTCSQLPTDCRACGEMVLHSGGKYPRGVHARIFEWYWTREPFQIVEGETWNGADFSLLDHVDTPVMEPFYVVTRRVVDWFVQNNVAPFVAAPIDVDVSRMTKKQLERLEECRLPIP